MKDTILLSMKLKPVVEKHVPLKRKIKLLKRKKRVSRDCLKSVKDYHKALKTYVHTKSAENYRKYCVARIRCSNVTRNAKRNFEKANCFGYENECKMFLVICLGTDENSD